MKTKFKTSSKSQKQSILDNRNFLNNQNYVFSRKNKNRLLSKVEYKYKDRKYKYQKYYTVY
jgi:hypothetical protein